MWNCVVLLSPPCKWPGWPEHKHYYCEVCNKSTAQTRVLTCKSMVRVSLKLLLNYTCGCSQNFLFWNTWSYLKHLKYEYLTNFSLLWIFYSVHVIWPRLKITRENAKLPKKPRNRIRKNSPIKLIVGIKDEIEYFICVIYQNFRAE